MASLRSISTHMTIMLKFVKFMGALGTKIYIVCFCIHNYLSLLKKEKVGKKVCMCVV